MPYASPSARLFARELGVDLKQVKGTGRKGRIQREDIQAFVKSALAGGARPAAAGGGGGAGLNLLPWPQVDFAKFGEVEAKPLSRIKKISGQNLSRNWVMIPAVTYHEDADITDLEAFRVQLNKENEKSGNKLTMLAFLIKACVKAMQRYPEFNASLDGDNLVLKKYFNIGFAADTPNGLVVPVIGTYIGGALPLLIALLNDPPHAIWVIVFLVIYQQLENYLLAPRISAATMAIHPAVAFGAAIAGASIIGPIGALLALPAAAIIQAFVSSYLERHEVIESGLTDALLDAATGVSGPPPPVERSSRSILAKVQRRVESASRTHEHTASREPESHEDRPTDQ